MTTEPKIPYDDADTRKWRDESWYIATSDAALSAERVALMTPKHREAARRAAVEQVRQARAMLAARRVQRVAA